MKECFDFLLAYDKTRPYLYLRNENTWQKLDSEVNGKFIIGYQYGNDDNRDSGEFIKISYDKENLRIFNDNYGTIPIYKYENGGKVLISTSLTYLLSKIGTKICLDINYLLKYFAFGYQVIENKTHYSDIEVFQHPIEITASKQGVILEKKKRDFFVPTSPLPIEDTYKILEDAFRKKLANIDFDKTILLLSGGKDSLLSSLIIKKLGFNPITATFGFKGSLDLKYGKLRNEQIFNSPHLSFFLEDFKITEDTFIEHANNQLGFGTASSIYYSCFLRKLRQAGYKNILFSDCFEYLRKTIESKAGLYNGYLTPVPVVKSYFNMEKRYSDIIKMSIDEIEKEYLDNPYYQFYYYDRLLKATYWKNALCRSKGLVRYNLSSDRKLVNATYNYAIGKDFPYSYYMEELLNTFNFSKDRLFPKEDENSLINATGHILCIRPIDTIYQFGEFFISLLEQHLKSSLAEAFNFGRIIEHIKTQTLVDGSEWFILRLLNLLIFCHYNKVSL